MLGDYKRVFWKFALGRLRRGEIEDLIGSALVAHHLIMFAREASVGQQNASNYSIGCARRPSLPSRPEMKAPAPPSRSLRDLRDLTPARVGLGRAGASLPTRRCSTSRSTTRAPATRFMPPSMCRPSSPALAISVWRHLMSGSCAPATATDYLRRPDLGRTLDPASRRSAGEPSWQPLPARHRGRRRPVAGGGQCARRSSWSAASFRGLALDGIEIGHAVVATRGARRAGRRDRRPARRAHDRDADRRAAGPVRAGQSRRLSDLSRRGRAAPTPSATASPTSMARGSATTKPPSGSRG